MKTFLVLLLSTLIIIGASFGVEESSRSSEYKLQCTDVISITVHGHPDLTTRTRITSDGFITFPLIGKVSAKDLSVQEFEQKLKELLEKDYLVKAEVNVFIEEYCPRQISVMGEVSKPGKYDMSGEQDITLMQSIAMAGGFSKNADITKIKVMRTENGEKQTILINAKDIIDNNAKDKDIKLKPEDIVFVTESYF